MIKSRIKEERMRKKMSQEQLGEMLGMTKTAISSYERGVREPQIDTLNSLADVFGCTSDYLIGRTDDRNAKVYSGTRNGDEIKIHIHKDYPHELTPEQVEKLLDQLNSVGFDVNKLIENAKK